AVSKTVRVAAGATFALRLPTNPLPGCTWTVVVAHGLLDVVEEGLSTANPPRWQVRLAARAVGEDEVTCAFSQPWDVEPSEVRTYRVLVVPPATG
ncbi:MAG: protease inhibitor I42 family protein, partial [Actinobacteria bacterium]|nr:protease inhibitor I42 family protein [Actinomycetota bacterium]